jgi:hypothetical protein
VRRSITALERYQEPLGVYRADDYSHIIVYLRRVDERLELLSWLAATFRPTQHRGNVSYHTLDTEPHIVISFVDYPDAGDLWALASALMGQVGVLNATVENNKCTVELAPNMDQSAVWEMLHAPDVLYLVTFEKDQKPRV